ncbi:hypothetical protein [Nostoc sp. CHAB 5715]|uniref:hypothetical protein n=1 Tax=Nostoc sp. CHAB 5715 TaxID=2780400 RepID=UPI001E4C228A|nr:hypothetical protein [Nostoc sp. CHAB 5715]MCC5625349.1 hypothetical protein [Nostoc sp. CHAB 5715]
MNYELFGRTAYQAVVFGLIASKRSLDNIVIATGRKILIRIDIIACVLGFKTPSQCQSL